MDNIRALVSEELNLIEHLFFDLFNSDKNSIFKDLSLFLRGKSKRIRSLVTLLYLKANNINYIDNNIVNLLFASELIHNASLLHDDVIDDSCVRRGKDNLYGKYGSKVSILSGDYLLSIAVELLLKLNNIEILELFLKATKNMSEAEMVQFDSRNCDISLEQYISVIEGKTASLFQAVIKSAAIMSGINSSIADKFAKYFGILFQVNNDLEDKSAQNDKKNGVKTVIDIIGIEKTIALKDNYKKELSKILVNVPDNKYKQGIEDLIKLL